MNKISLFILANRSKLFILLFNDQKKILFGENDHEKKFSEVFFMKIKLIMEKENLIMSQIHKIYAGIGPGSFLIHREIVTFLKTIKILNKNIEIFTINNLIYQAGQEKKVISLMEANKKQHYIKIINNNKIVNKIKTIEKDNLNEMIKQYQEYTVYKNFEKIDHWKQFQKMKNEFQKVLNWKKLKAIEL